MIDFGLARRVEEQTPSGEQIRKGNITIDPPSGYHTLLTDVLAGRLPTSSNFFRPKIVVLAPHELNNHLDIRCIKDNCAGRTMAKGWPDAPRWIYGQKERYLLYARW